MSEYLNLAESSQSRPVHEVVTSLKNYIRKSEAITFILGLKDGRILEEWVRNATQHVDPITETKLLVTESLASTVYDDQRPHVSSAWLISMNPYLDDEVPADLIQSLKGTAADEATVELLQQAAENYLRPLES